MIGGQLHGGLGCNIDGGSIDATITTIHSRDRNGRLTKLEDARNNQSTFEYDTLDRRTKLVYPEHPKDPEDPESETHLYTYNQASDLIAETDPNATEFGYTYDRLSRRTEVRVDLVSPGSGAAATHDGNRVTACVHCLDAAAAGSVALLSAAGRREGVRRSPRAAARGWWGRGMRGCDDTDSRYVLRLWWVRLRTRLTRPASEARGGGAGGRISPRAGAWGWLGALRAIPAKARPRTAGP